MQYIPSNVRGCNITHPVCTYSTNCRNTSASNSSIIITVGDVTIVEVFVIIAVPTALPRLYFDQEVDVLVPADAILLLFLMLFLFGGDFCCCCLIYVNNINIQYTNKYNKNLILQFNCIPLPLFRQIQSYTSTYHNNKNPYKNVW